MFLKSLYSFSFIAFSLVASASADSIFQIRYSGEDNTGFTILYDATNPPANNVVTGNGTVAPFESIFIGPSAISPALFGPSGGQFQASADIIVGVGATEIQFFLTENGAIINQSAGVIFSPILGVVLPGQTSTETANQVILPEQNPPEIGIATLTVTNVSPEPAAFGLVSMAGLGLVIWGIKRVCHASRPWQR
jgi:hypothetical protein